MTRLVPILCLRVGGLQRADDGGRLGDRCGRARRRSRCRRDGGPPDDGGDLDANVPDGGADGSIDSALDANADVGIEDRDAGSDSGPDSSAELDSGPVGGPCSSDTDCAPALTCVPPTDVCGCPPPLAVLDDPGATAQTLVLSEIDPGPGGYVELYNNSASPIALGSSPASLCSPFRYASIASLGAGITIPAFGYALIPWPADFADTDAGGELQIYATGAFGVPEDVVDFVCWGTNPHGSRIAEAFTAGKWSASSAASCAPALTGGAIHRRIATDGVDAADYDTVTRRTPAACAP